MLIGRVFKFVSETKHYLKFLKQWLLTFAKHIDRTVPFVSWTQKPMVKPGFLKKIVTLIASVIKIKK